MTFTATVTATSVATVLTRLPFANSDQTILVKYIRSNPTLGVSRKGELTINITTATTPNTAVTDRFSYVGSTDGGIEFTADINTNTVKLLYTSTNNFGTLEYQYSYLQ
jgi:hypothetical protein